MVASWLLVLHDSATSADSSSLVALSVVALAMTLLFCVMFFVQYQTQLLGELCKSFDVVFLLLHYAMAHACVGDLFRWKTGPTVVVLSSWIWIQWVVTLDAFTPMMKARWSFRIRYATPVLVVSIAIQCVLVGDLVFWNALGLQDRVFYSFRFRQRAVEFRVVPFYFSRTIVTFLWTLRLLWRIWRRQHEHELVMIRGNVEYDYISSSKLHHARNESTDDGGDDGDGEIEGEDAVDSASARERRRAAVRLARWLRRKQHASPVVAPH